MLCFASRSGHLDRLRPNSHGRGSVLEGRRNGHRRISQISRPLRVRGGSQVRPTGDPVDGGPRPRDVLQLRGRDAEGAHLCRPGRLRR